MATDEGLPDVTETAAITETTTQPSTITPGPNKKKKNRKRASKTHILSQSTIRNPPWSYIHLQHLTFNSLATTPALDAVTAHLQITAALTQFLGLHGAAIPIDILKTEGSEVWIRVPAEDHSALLAAVGGWVSGKGEGWRVKGSSSWDTGAMARDSGQDLFDD
ncbi:hypothetical protein B0A54_09295 [Friedmanniomyces endolithicus]|uniref:Ribonucleases P/MRP subunit Pop8-like domain-containing protein n=1 Tax=Friedmanniomyces endolithicus TaxID=329885 RepID=A0A4U0UYI3_9PEZI|nr:hypothetical protein LTS09_013470 [Friedmanniomyces endolithicus]KAK0303466.1 hypothetical protein LTR01_008021 [Friedmanniomyces endolithicus]KAK0824127.1 hypothetical protein LTR73_007994 [Friedmanniomyces endolithicus]TKA40346.1 hypothetical protein B0A54_09295 [Friedmanniomyces endolithicus]